MKRLRLRMFGLLLAVLIAAVPATAQDTGTISGMVTSSDDDLIPTVVIVAFSADSTSSDGGLRYAAPVDPDGQYRIGDVVPGDYYVLAEGPEFGLQFYDGAESIADATLVQVVGGQEASGIDFDLSKPGAGTAVIQGAVLDAEDDAPIADARITAWFMSGAFFRLGASSDSAGQFSLDGIRGGTYQVLAEAEGYLPLDPPVLVDVVEGDTLRGLTLSLSQGAGISGTISDSTGQGVADLLVRAEGTEFSVLDSTAIGPDGQMYADTTFAEAYTYTRPNGTYTFDRLEAGTYRVGVELDPRFGGQEVIWYPGVRDRLEADSVSVAAGVVAENINIVVPAPAGAGGLSGRTLTVDGVAVAHAIIEAWPLQGDDTTDPSGQCCGAFGWAQSDEEGQWRMSDLPEGEYLVSATARLVGFPERVWWPAGPEDEAAPVPVMAGEVTEGIDLLFEKGGGDSSLSGRITDSSGAALAGAYVHTQPLRSQDGGFGTYANAQTDSTGEYRFRALSPGEYLVAASWFDGERYGQAWYPGVEDPGEALALVVVADTAMQDVDFALDVRPLFGSVEGVVRDADSGAPLARALVELYPVGRDDRQMAGPVYFQLSTVTDQEGRFRLEQVYEGEFLLSAAADGGFAYFGGAFVPELAEPVRVKAGEVALADIDIERRNDGSGMIAGRVDVDSSVWWADSSGVNVDWVAVVEARPAVSITLWPDSERAYTTVTSEDGSYELSGLADGDYLVSTRAPDYLPVYYDGVFDAAEATLVSVTDSPAATDIDFLLLPHLYFGPEDGLDRGASASIHGHVHDASGQALSGAIIVILDANGDAVASAQTDVDGFYEVVGLLPGEYRVMVSKPGHPTAYNGNATDMADALPVTVDGRPTEVDLVMGVSSTSREETASGDLPARFVLHGNYPNPFNPMTTIVMDVPESGTLSIQVFDVLGRSRLTRHAGTVAAGVGRSVTLDASSLPSGMYFYRVQVAGSQATGRMTVLR